MDKLQDTRGPPEDALHPTRTLGQMQQGYNRLRIALYNIAQYDVPRPVAHPFRDDGKPSKNDRCNHNVAMYDECAGCLSQYADDVLRGLEHGSSNFLSKEK
jgi:hypothetical protein